MEHYPYQDGLLVWDYDTLFANNNVGDNCASERCGGLMWRPMVQTYDSTFGLRPTDVVCLHRLSMPQQRFGGLPGNPVFDDSLSYWVAPDPSINNFGWSSVIVPHTGTTIRVLSTDAQGEFM